jgi:glycosyltransferase involved in cell wall biosynthesis
MGKPKKLASRNTRGAKSMKIVQIIPDFSLGGIPKAGVVLAKYFSLAGHTCLVIGRGPGPRADALKNSGVSVAICLSDADAVRVLHDFMPDVVHVHGRGFDEPFVQSAISLATDFPIIVTPVFGRVPADRSLLKRVTTCCVGLYTHARFCHWLGIPVHSAIKEGIVFAELTPFDDLIERKFDNDIKTIQRITSEVVFGRVGRETVQKWHPATAAMVSKILTAVPHSRWVSVGWPAELGLKEMHAKWGNRFQNLSETSNEEILLETFRTMDLHFFASRYGECFSSTICEAASMGVPTLALVHPFNDAGEIEQVIEGETGWLANDVTEMIKKAIAALQDPCVLADRGRCAQEYSTTYWTITRVGPKVFEIYNAAYESNLARLGDIPAFARAIPFADTYRKRMTQSIQSLAPWPLSLLLFWGYHNSWFWSVGRGMRKIVSFIMSTFQR